ncbi:penicillin acylase family protein [Roseomonas elaeocarpi]|uniref:Penicillin acylase family protein n=1 Tax=Roseomonas elaeocarpi TaxID=907779 RepID=A0ABV6JXH5_9PROT
MPRRQRSFRRFVLRSLSALVVLILVLPGAVAGLLWWTLPGRDETLDLPGLSAPVEITLDRDGVPRIRANNEFDAAMALGVLHARDRMFQMELMRRGASGRLSEIAGPATLRADRFTRTLGLARRAEADLAVLDEGTRRLLDAYAAGVNSWISARGRFAAPEFLLLGAPEPWTARDSLLWGKVMGLYLSGNWRAELQRARVAGKVTAEQLEDLWPTDRSSGRAEVAALSGGSAPEGSAPGGPAPEGALPAAALPGLGPLLAALPEFPVDAPLPSTASNAWAVSASRSTTGGALLASDPHLGFGAPILWYLARIDLPGGRMLAGATAPGVPFMVIGRNERLAWGFTTTTSDTQDSFVERLVGKDQYETPEGPRPFTVREERIAVRGRPDEILRVRETRHGPVLSDLDLWPDDGTVLAVAMANLAPDDTAPSGLRALNLARNLDEAGRAVARITSPPQNITVADRDGGVAMFLSGRTPVRAGGDGSMPSPGWDGSHDWTGWVPFDAMPNVVRPAGGMVANANNRVQPEGSPVFLARDWPGDWRFRRIAEVLRSRPRHAPEDFAALQNDSVSLLARDLLPRLRALPRPWGEVGAARDLLLGWDGQMAPDRPQPLIFNAWLAEFGRLVLAKAGNPEGLRASAEFVAHILGDEAAGRRWCGDAGCDATVGEALERAVRHLTERFGGEPASWRWGAAHVARFEHPLLKALPLLGRLTTIAVATPGDDQTVNRGGTTEDFADVHGAGLRLVADLSDTDGLLAVTATGQSGNPLSGHWADLTPRWVRGQFLRLGLQAEAVERLHLRPSAAPRAAPRATPQATP